MLMHLSRSCSLVLLAGLVLSVVACERPEEPDQPVPPGVSVQPPRTVGETGSLGLPGAGPDTLIEADDPPGQPRPVDAPLTDTLAPAQP
jgi:hypothetical protein